jgi:zinc protease
MSALGDSASSGGSDVTKSVKHHPAHQTARADLDGGGVLLVEESHALPLVSIVVSLRSGSAFDPVGKEGLARIVGRMLRRGCEGMKAHAIEDAIDRLGGEISIDLSASSLSVHGQVIGRNLDPFIDLFARLLGTPEFPLDELERLKRETAAEILESRDNDRALAQKFFRQNMFAGHPYGRSSHGTLASVEAIGEADVRAFYARHFTRANTVLGFAGDVTLDRARAVSARLLAKLPTGAEVADPVSPPPHLKGRHLVLVDKPDRTQTQIIIGGMGTSPHDDDHVALGVANAIFGGSFTSRLMKAVRSERGWSYGAYARMAIDRQRQAFSMWTFPQATDAAPCIGLELELLEAWVTGGVTQAELDFIKQYLIRSQAFEVDTAPKRLHQALDIEVIGLPKDYHSGYSAKVAEVTTESANAAVKRRISAADLLVVVVGTADQIRPQVEKAVGPVVDLKVVPFDADSMPGPRTENGESRDR